MDLPFLSVTFYNNFPFLWRNILSSFSCVSQTSLVRFLLNFSFLLLFCVTMKKIYFSFDSPQDFHFCVVFLTSARFPREEVRRRVLTKQQQPLHFYTKFLSTLKSDSDDDNSNNNYYNSDSHDWGLQRRQRRRQRWRTMAAMATMTMATSNRVSNDRGRQQRQRRRRKG